MGTRKTRNLPARLEGVRRQFERWRRTRKGRSRIPEALWATAVKAAGQHGLCRTAQTLRLDYYALKKRVEAAECLSGEQGGAGFIELPPAVPAGSPECILELEDPRGAKMRIHLKGGRVPDVTALSESFWGVEA